MGLHDRFRETAGNAREKATDAVANATGKANVGFDPDVCQGCQFRGQGECGFCGQEDCDHLPCGKCGCPTIEGWPMDRLGTPPEDCPRLAQHAQSRED